MMVPFSGRSRHTLKMKNKPISEEFKVWALCKHGYLWDFLFFIRVRLVSLYILWWGEMAPPLKRSPDLGNSSPVPRALMYVASLQTFNNNYGIRQPLRPLEHRKHHKDRHCMGF
jgi:hypothetical protein